MTLPPPIKRHLGTALAILFTLASLYIVTLVYAAGETLLAGTLLVMVGLALWIYSSAKTYAYRYLFPGIAAALVFVVFPMLYTVTIGFTNYSSKNLLQFRRATNYLTDQTYQAEGPTYDFTLHHLGSKYMLRMVDSEKEDSVFLLGPLALEGSEIQAVKAVPVITKPGSEAYRTALKSISEPAAKLVPPGVNEFYTTNADGSLTSNHSGVVPKMGEELPLDELINHQKSLQALSVTVPGGEIVTMSGLHEFGPIRPVFTKNADGSLTNNNPEHQTLKVGEIIRPNWKDGFYETTSGDQIEPGFQVSVGWENYQKILSDQAMREPFLRIFIWTIVFAFLSVLFSISLGVVLAVVLNWDILKGKGVYRLLLFLPYAVPGFISILVFKGLFNSNSGEINLILHSLLGIKPAWFSSPFLAKSMLLIVNTWLGFPYMMIICMGLIKAIPADLYEASAVAGAGPLTNFFKITVPLIKRPLMPILIASFAFNFNNFVLIELLTGGRPDFLNTAVPAGTTDILVSYTYRMAFQDSGQQFGLAAAISTVIFLMVAGVSLIQIRAARIAEDETR